MPVIDIAVPKTVPEGDATQVFKVQYDAKGNVVELYSGEDDGEQEHGHAQAGRRADEVDDQLLGAVYQ